jgi:hypothetical protein
MSTPAQDRRAGALRTALIGYGVAAFSYLLARPGSAGEAKALGFGGSASTFLLTGLGLQAFLIVARLVMKRLVPDRAVAGQLFLILELIGDGVTVLLFALATFGAIQQVPAEL